MARSLRSVLLLSLIVALATAAEEAPKPPYVGEITGSGVRIRGGDGITYLVLAHSEAGQRVTVRDGRFGWLAIDVPESCTVWIHKSMVERAEGSETAIVVKDKVNIRARAEIKSDILGQVPRGTKLRVVDEDGDWIGITPPPQTRAWIHGKFVRKVGELTAAKPPATAPKDGMDRAAGAELLGKADTLYRQELLKPMDERDLDAVLGIYQKVASKCQDKALAAQAEGARQRLLKILDLMAAVKKADTSVREFEKKYRTLEEEYKRRARGAEK
jgi:uncharacterized protein YgiM (DUF1202 family)